MTAELWLKKYYPIDAKKAADRGLVAAVEHGQLKYSGCTKEALKEHGLVYAYDLCPVLRTIGDPYVTVMTFGRLTCALCILCSAIHRVDLDVKACPGCPLFEIGAGCLKQGSPYKRFLSRGDPTKILKAFEKALTWAREHYE